MPLGLQLSVRSAAKRRRHIPIKCKSGITLSFCFESCPQLQHQLPHALPLALTQCCPLESSAHARQRIRMQFVLPQLILFMSLGYKYICEIAYLCRCCCCCCCLLCSFPGGVPEGEGEVGHWELNRVHCGAKQRQQQGQRSCFFFCSSSSAAASSCL